MFALVKADPWKDGIWIPRITLAPVLLAMALLLQLLLGLSAYSETIWLAVLYLLWLSGMIFLGAYFRKEFTFEILVRWFSWAALLGGLISALFGLLQYLQWQGFFGALIAPHIGGAAYGNLAQANHFANYLSVALVGLGYLFVTGRIAIPAGVVSLLALLLGMTLSGSRSTWLFLALFVIVAYLIYWRSAERTGKLLCKTVLFVIPIYAVIQFLVMQLDVMQIAVVASTHGLTTGERLISLSSAESPRWFLWQQAWHMFMHAPLLGVGWGEYSWQFFLHFSDFPNNAVPTIDPNAHNFVLHLLATTGLLGALAILVPLAAWMWRVKSLPVSPEKWWLICILAVQAVHGSLEYNLWYAQFLGVVGLLLGMGETREYHIFSASRKWVGWLWGAVLVIACVQLVDIMRDYRTLEGWVYTRKNFNQGDPSTRVRQMQADLLDLRSSSLLSPYVDLSHPELTVPASAPLADKLAFDLRVMRFAPNSEVVYRHAMMLALNSELPAAKQQLDRAIAVYPNDLGLFVQRITSLAANQPVTLGDISRYAQDKLRAISSAKQQ